MSIDDASESGPLSDGLAALFDLHRVELRRFVAARCDNPGDADDILQDLWLRLQQQHSGPIAHPRAYLFRAANNLVLNRERDRQRSMRRDHEWLELAAPAGHAMADRPDPTPTPEDAAAQREVTALIEQAISELPPGAQRALRLCRIEGMNQTEAAQVLGITRSGVEKHLAVAMRLLREKLSDCGLLHTSGSRKGWDASGGTASKEAAT